MPISDYYLPHLLAVLWFVICWVGYTRYAQVKGRTTPCLASVLHLYREDWMRRMDALAAYSLHCAARKLDDSVIATAQAAGIPVLCFTVNDRQDAEALLARGVTAVFSDRIDSLRGL